MRGLGIYYYLCEQFPYTGEFHAHTPQEKELLRREIAAADAEIDRVVYQLYGLTEEEIKIVEVNE
jgi:hypothetical protein